MIALLILIAICALQALVIQTWTGFILMLIAAYCWVKWQHARNAAWCLDAKLEIAERARKELNDRLDEVTWK